MKLTIVENKATKKIRKSGFDKREIFVIRRKFQLDFFVKICLFFIEYLLEIIRVYLRVFILVEMNENLVVFFAGLIQLKN